MTDRRKPSINDEEDGSPFGWGKNSWEPVRFRDLPGFWFFMAAGWIFFLAVMFRLWVAFLR